MYDDDYGTCARTYATLLIYPVRTEPEAITQRLGIGPSSWQRRGEPTAYSLRRPSRVAEIDGWFLTTRGLIESRDSRRHIDWLLDQIEGKAMELRSLLDEGSWICITCYWAAASCGGGPTISPEQMRRLGALNIELSFDLYFHGEDESAKDFG
jgi:Domain of unknown function (DUF4279)